VKEIVHHYKGEISVKSEIGKGSEFKVEFLLEENQNSFEKSEEFKSSLIS
jgi:signal transduction histidine kinase